jgi:CheY-like chemotaxis protein
MAEPLVFHPRRVLVVDDCDSNRKLLAAILSHRQVIFDEASNGKEALAKLEVKDFDLVLMDVQMPIMDGFAAVSEIRRLWPNKDLAVIALTASTDDLKGDSYRKAGFTGKLLKPFAICDIDSLLFAGLHTLNSFALNNVVQMEAE